MKRLINGDCFEHLKSIPLASVDLIFCDLPYNITACHWDNEFELERLWGLFDDILKSNGAVVMTANQPFTSRLIMSKIGWFKYELIWRKTRNSHPFFAKKRPLPIHESILVFSKEGPRYFPQMVKGKPHKIPVASGRTSGEKPGKKWMGETKTSDHYYPTSVVDVPNPSAEAGLHPTQKPVALLEWIIRTYTQEGDTVLDPTAGSMTTAVACINTNRNFIMIEKSKEYFEIGKKRVMETCKKTV